MSLSIAPTVISTTPVWAMVAGSVAGALLAGASLAMIRPGRGSRQVNPTRLTLGLCGLIIGYHVMAWSMPDGWLALRVPVTRWWAVVLVAALALGGSLLADRLDGRVTHV